MKPKDQKRFRASIRLAVLLVLASLALGVLACGSAAVSSSEAGVAGLGRKIRQLETGDSIATVEEALGPAERENEAGGEKVLYYGHWQLSFSPKLRSRTKYFWEEHWKNPQALSHAIRHLAIGETIREVRKRLGSPFALQILKSHSPERVTLWYGNGRWALKFLDGGLAGTTEA
jgi:hypothetical protein